MTTIPIKKFPTRMHVGCGKYPYARFVRLNKTG